MFQRPAQSENAQKFQRIMQIPCSSPTASANYAKFAPFVTHYILCFRCLISGRELPTIPANQVKFAQFANGSHEFCEFCTFRTKLHPYLVH